jgi:hypothetical protein
MPRVPGALQHVVLLRRPGTPVALDHNKPGSRISGAPRRRLAQELSQPSRRAAPRPGHAIMPPT